MLYGAYLTFFTVPPLLLSMNAEPHRSPVVPTRDGAFSRLRDVEFASFRKLQNGLISAGGTQPRIIS
jgi:hypothetical protein